MSHIDSHHSFSMELAEELSVYEAIIVHHFQHWIKVNRKGKKNKIDGRTWTYQRLEDIADHFPYFSKDQVKRIIDKLVKKEIIIKGNYNKNILDQTVWYAFKDEKKFIVDNAKSSKNVSEMAKSPNGQAKSPNGDGEIANCIIGTDTKPIYLKENKETADAVCVYGKFVKLTDTEYDSLTEKFGKENVDAKIEEMNDYISSIGREEYKDYAATLRNWFRKEKGNGASSGSSSDENKALAEKIILKFSKQSADNHIQLQEKSLLFVYGTVWEEILFTENGFKDRVFSRLRKMNLPTDGL